MGEKEGGHQKKGDGGKKEEGPITVVLKVDTHCEGCAAKIKRAVKGFHGVEHVAVDRQKDLVTVKGTMDAKTLPEYLKEKHKRPVEIVQPKKDDGAGTRRPKKEVAAAVVKRKTKEEAAAAAVAVVKSKTKEEEAKRKTKAAAAVNRKTKEEVVVKRKITEEVVVKRKTEEVVVKRTTYGG